MFTQLEPVDKSRRKRCAMAASVAVHLVFLAVILVHRPPVIELSGAWLANGRGTQSFQVIYAPNGSDDLEEEPKLTLTQRSRTPRHRPKASVDKPTPDRLQVPADAIASDHAARAGSPLGTVLDGPIEGHEVHVAYPVVFPDPLVSRSELPADVKGDVIVEVTIDSQGNVVETRIVQAIGHGIDEKIITALRQWRYQPATLDGVPVASKHDVHFHFPS